MKDKVSNVLTVTINTLKVTHVYRVVRLRATHPDAEQADGGFSCGRRLVCHVRETSRAGGRMTEYGVEL